MKIGKKRLLHALLSYMGRCPDATRLRWGRALGWLLPRVMRRRAHIVRVNLACCFPRLSTAEREAIGRRHFHLLAQSYLDRGLLWFGSPERIAQAIEVRGTENLQSLLDAGRRVLIFAPHFVGLDAAGTANSMIFSESATFYTEQKDPDLNALIVAGRARFNKVHLISRSAGIRGLIRLLRQGVPIYYLPDMDFGREGSIFVPFFGIPAATLPSAAQIAANSQAALVPITSSLDLKSGRYTITIGAALADFPGDDSLEQATARLNRLIEDAIRPDPAQYYWVHRRFKTRPLGEAKIY